MSLISRTKKRFNSTRRARRQRRIRKLRAFGYTYAGYRRTGMSPTKSYFMANKLIK